MELSVTLDVRYVPGAILAADAALAYLTTEVEWLDHMRARRTASFGLPYDYSGQRYPACELPPLIAAIAERAAALAGHAFNNCLCNRYETGANTMGFHADSYEGLVPSSTIAIASFGAARRLVFRGIAKQTELLLEHGSLLLMTEATQSAWRHALPRDPKAGLRISATLRLIRA
jgi:alkylated DNA repair dioxygenase AlkB